MDYLRSSSAVFEYRQRRVTFKPIKVKSFAFKREITNKIEGNDFINVSPKDGVKRKHRFSHIGYDKFIIVFIDDVLIYLEDPKEHNEHFRITL